MPSNTVRLSWVIGWCTLLLVAYFGDGCCAVNKWLRLLVELMHGCELMCLWTTAAWSLTCACTAFGDGCMFCELYLDVCVNCSCSVNYSMVFDLMHALLCQTSYVTIFRCMCDDGTLAYLCLSVMICGHLWRCESCEFKFECVVNLNVKLMSI